MRHYGFILSIEKNTKSMSTKFSSQMLTVCVAILFLTGSLCDVANAFTRYPSTRENLSTNQSLNRQRIRRQNIRRIRKLREERIGNYWYKTIVDIMPRKQSHLKNRWDIHQEKKQKRPLLNTEYDNFDGLHASQEKDGDCTKKFGKGKADKTMLCVGYGGSNQSKGSKRSKGKGKISMDEITGKGKGKEKGRSSQPTAQPNTIVPNRVPTPQPAKNTWKPSPSLQTPSQSPSTALDAKSKYPINPPILPPSFGSSIPLTMPISGDTSFSPAMDDSSPVSTKPFTSTKTDAPTAAGTSNGTQSPSLSMDNHKTLKPSILPTIKSSIDSDMPSLSPMQSGVEIETPTSKPSNTTTSVPTISLVRQATPFAVTYFGVNTTFSDKDFQDAQSATEKFLADYLTEQFQVNEETYVDDILSNTLEVNSTPLPPNAAYKFEVVFTNNSSFIPTADEVDVLLESAFLDPARQRLVASLMNLSSDNPFSGVFTVEFLPRFDLDERTGRKNATVSEETPPAVVVDGHVSTSNQTNAPPSRHIANDTFFNITSTLPPEIVDDDLSANATQTTPHFVKKDNNTHSSDVFTRYNSANLKLSPFSIFYQTQGENPTAVDIDQTANATLSYLDSYMRSMFESVQIGSYIYMAGFGVGDMVDGTNISFAIGVLIAEDLSLKIHQKEIDEIVEVAFEAPFSSTLLSSLHALPTGNPFSTTAAFDYESSPVASTRGTSTDPLFSTTTIAITLFVVAFLTYICLFTVRRQRNRITKRSPTEPTTDQSLHGNLLDLFSDKTMSVRSSVKLYLDHEESEIEFQRTLVDPLFR